MKTTSDSFRIERAQIGDLAGIIELFEAAAVWLEGEGVLQWPTRVSPHFRKFLRQKVTEGNVFVAQGQDGRLKGHIRFDFEAGKVWHDNPVETAYVRGLVIANEVRGQGVGAGLLDWAQDYAREMGCVRLRLDCLAENGRLRRYYRDYGFTLLGEGNSGSYTAALFELNMT